MASNSPSRTPNKLKGGDNRDQPSSELDEEESIPLTNQTTLTSLNSSIDAAASQMHKVNTQKVEVYDDSLEKRPSKSNKRTVSNDDDDERIRHETTDTCRTPIGWRPIIPDGGWGWVVVFGSFLIHVFADGFVYSFGIIMVELLNSFDSGRSWTSWIVSILVGLTLGAGPLASAVTNRYGCRVTTMLGAVVASIGCAVSVFATSIVHLLLSIGLITGMGFGLMYCPAIVIVTMYFEEKRAFATGIAVCGAGIGTFIFAPLSQVLIDEYTWRGALLIYAGIILNCAVCGALFRPLEFEPIYEEDEHLENSQNLLSVQMSPKSEMDGNISPPNSPESTSPLSLPRISLSEHHVTQANGVVVQVEPVIDQSPSPSNMLGANNFDSQQKAFSCMDVTPDEKQRTGNGFADSLPLPRTTSLYDEMHNESSDAVYRSTTISHTRSRAGTGTRRRGITESSGYLDVKDVFYPGSVTHLASFSTKPDFYRSVHSITDRHIVKGTHNQDKDTDRHRKDTVSSYAPSETSVDYDRTACKDFIRVMRSMANVSLLADPTFLLFVVSNILTSVGLNPPLIFLPDKGNELNIDPTLSAFFISAFGISNTIGRVAFGYISDKPLPCRHGRNPAINRLFIYSSLITVCGVATLVSCFCHTAPSLMLYSAVFGVGLSGYVCLTSVLLVDLVGLDKLTNAFGLLLLFQGIGSVVGAPIAGWIVDSTGSYDLSFAFAGICLFVSGVILFAVPFLKPDFGKINSTVGSGNGL